MSNIISNQKFFFSQHRRSSNKRTQTRSSLYDVEENQDYQSSQKNTWPFLSEDELSLDSCWKSRLGTAARDRKQFVFVRPSIFLCFYSAGLEDMIIFTQVSDYLSPYLGWRGIPPFRVSPRRKQDARKKKIFIISLRRRSNDPLEQSPLLLKKTLQEHLFFSFPSIRVLYSFFVISHEKSFFFEEEIVLESCNFHAFRWRRSTSTRFPRVRNAISCCVVMAKIYFFASPDEVPLFEEQQHFCSGLCSDITTPPTNQAWELLYSLFTPLLL